MNKFQKHAKATEFRNEIASVAFRKQNISALLEKQAWDEADMLRATILFQKASYLDGCEAHYPALIRKVQKLGLGIDTTSFSKKLKLV
jgi:hypothetical protein